MGFFDLFRNTSHMGHTVCDTDGKTVARINTRVVAAILDDASYSKYFIINKHRNAYVYTPRDIKAMTMGVPVSIKIIMYPGYSISAVAENIM